MDDPKIAKRLALFHLVCTVFWLPFTALAYFLGWLESVVFVSLISMLALFLGSFSSWQASRSEVKLDKEQARRHPIKNFLRKFLD